MLRLAAATLACLAAAIAAAHAEPSHGIAMHGEPALGPDFTHFSYANPDAPKGGTVNYCVIGSFDNLNPFIIKSLRTTARGVIDTIFGNLVFEPLMQRNADEPFTLYGLLAEKADMPDDRSWIEFTLDPRAEWSDGEPVTPQDVIFTYRIFAEHGRPPYSDRAKRVERIEQTGERNVRFTFKDNLDREFPFTIAMTPILPRHAFDEATFEDTTLEPVTGSGPYIIDQINPGQRIVYRRNPDYWGRDVPSKRGFDNYDRIVIDYFLNTNAAFEAFKKGLCSIYTDADPVQRARGMDFPAAERGDVVQETFTNGLPPVATGFLFNTRLPKFSNPRVREALGMLYDFEWANRNLLDGKFRRLESFWQGSELSALGHPAGEAEKAFLAKWPGRVPPAIMDGSYRLPETDGSGQDRKVLKAALDILKGQGFRIEGGTMLDAAGQPFGFEIFTASQEQERQAAIFQRALQRLGINVAIRMLDDTQIQQRKQRFDFEVIIGSVGFSNSLSPGAEQIGRWGSAAAEAPGSFNLAGVADPAIDAAIDWMLAARETGDYVAAVRALDRLLISGHYIATTQYNPEQWMARWNYLQHPEKTPLYGYQLNSWWRKP